MWLTLINPSSVAVAVLAIASLIACGTGEAVGFVQVSAGARHTCGLRSDGTVVCWGSDEYRQLQAPSNERFTAIDAGGIYTCGLRSDGTAVCWGFTTHSGEDLAKIGSPHYSAPFPPEEERFTKIAAGGDQTCGIRQEGRVICWDIRSKLSPFGTEEIVDISVGAQQVCGLPLDSRVLCEPFSLLAPSEEERFGAISMGAIHSCGLTLDGRAFCEGVDMAGQLSPPEEGPFSAIVSGVYHPCALTTDGAVLCWGFDLKRAAEFDDPGMGVNAVGMEFLFDTHRSEPPEDERFKTIDAGYWHTCGLRQDGGVSCWGYDHQGQASPPSD